MKRKALLHHELLRSLSLPHQKREVWRRNTFVNEEKNGRIKPVFICLSEYGFQEKYLPYCSPCFFQILQRIFSSLRVTIGVTTKEKGATVLPVTP
ncbi:hypothetical protein [Desulfovibrio desulfuricans]|uniref:hypothetical protein n=1 Tax=Desulfovibrio desulfuricans TaxID=876 RepID=UPI00131BA108|nr:hypothetical protein [Desulfovibrio desulfuricans]